MEYCYVVSGRNRYQDLGDAIEEAKTTLFQRLKLRNIKTPAFTMRDTGNRIIVKATYKDYGNSYDRGSRSVCIRRDKINPPKNYNIVREYSEFSL